MIQTDEATIRKVIFHKVNVQEDKISLSDELCDFLNEDEADVIKKAFLKPFQGEYSKYQFCHEYDIELNALYKLTKSIYEGQDFIEYSKNIGQHLKTVSKHPNIKDGDLFVIHFDNIIINNAYCEAIGVFKVENKDTFIETEFKGNKSAHMEFRKGISTRKIEKGGLVIFTPEPYTVMVIDNVKQGTEYWQTDFLSVTPVKNEYLQTHQFLGITKEFVTSQLTEDVEISRADQIDLLNRSVDYFKTNENFDKEEFEKAVFSDSAVIDSFRKFDQNYRDENEIELPDSFEISKQAVKKQAKIFKSVLKLDTNFHVYIHGRRNMIEQGIDENGRKFYKIFYENES